MNEIVYIKVFSGYQRLGAGGLIIIISGYRGLVWDDGNVLEMDCGDATM